MGEGLGRGEVLQREMSAEWQGKGEGAEIVNPMAAVFASLLLLAIAAFCWFGFLATLEPTTNTTAFMTFRILYATVGVGSLLGLGLLAARARRR